MKKCYGWLSAFVACALLVSGCGGLNSNIPTENRITEAVETAAPTPTPDNNYTAIRTHEVDSSCFSRVGYDKDQEILKVQFRESGVYYVYFDFPADEYNSFIYSDSLGGYFNAHIKGEYEYERLR